MSPSRVPCPLLQRVAGTAGTHKGKEKEDPSAEPGVLTSMPPPAPIPLCSQTPPRLQEAGTEPHGSGLVRGGQKATMATLQCQVPSWGPLAWTPLPIPSRPPLCLFTETPQGQRPQSRIQISLLFQVTASLPSILGSAGPSLGPRNEGSKAPL